MKARSHARHLALALRALRAALTHMRDAAEVPPAEGAYTSRLARIEATRVLAAVREEHQRNLRAERRAYLSARAA